jgi:hypothetical protein
MSDNNFDPLGSSSYFNYFTALARDDADKERQKARDANTLLSQERIKNADLVQNNIKKEIEEQEKIAILHRNIARKQAEINHYQNLLSKPMAEIASKNQDFKKTYELQQRSLASWMIAQKAVQETLFKIASDAGKTGEEVKEVYKESLNNVLNDKTKFGNNASDNPVSKEYKDDIKRNGLSL